RPRPVSIPSGQALEPDRLYELRGHAGSGDGQGFQLRPELRRGRVCPRPVTGSRAPTPKTHPKWEKGRESILDDLFDRDLASRVSRVCVFRASSPIPKHPADSPGLTKLRLRFPQRTTAELDLLLRRECADRRRIFVERFI